MPVKNRKGKGTDDPVIEPVSDGSGNKPLPTSLKRDKGKGGSSRSDDKSSQLLNKFKGPSRDSAGGRFDQAAFNKQHYGDLDSDCSDSDADEGDGSAPPRRRIKKQKGYFEGIKWGPVALLLMMTMTGLVPMVMLAADNIGPAISKVMPSFNLAPTMVAMGLVATPKKRLREFYIKHDQIDKLDESKLDETIMKYAGDYGTLTKRLERKYQDYGYFIGWDQEGSLADVQKKTFEWVTEKGSVYYQKYVPFPLRNGMRRASTNANYYWKRVYKTLDKWTAPPASSSKGGKRSSTSKKSKRSRNSQFRED